MTLSGVSAGQRSLSLFSVHAPEDGSLYKRLEEHLRSLRSQYSLSMESVDDILPGTNRGAEVERYLNDAQIILLLISSGFFVHWYDIMIYALQLQRRKHVLVVPNHPSSSRLGRFACERATSLTY